MLGIAELEELLEIASEVLLQSLIVERCYNLGLCKRWFVAIGCLYVEGHNAAHPTLTVDDIGNPAQLLNRFEHTTCKEYSAFAIIFILNTCLIALNESLYEVIIVIDEIYLYAS